MTEPLVASTGRDVLCRVARLDSLDDLATWAVSGNFWWKMGFSHSPRLSAQMELGCSTTDPHPHDLEEGTRHKYAKRCPGRTFDLERSSWTVPQGSFGG